MLLINIIDNQNRFNGIKFDPLRSGEQEDSHTISYLYARQQLKTIGEHMGLDCDQATYNAYLARNKPQLNYNPRLTTPLRLDTKPYDRLKDPMVKTYVPFKH